MNTSAMADYATFPRAAYAARGTLVCHYCGCLLTRSHTGRGRLPRICAGCHNVCRYWRERAGRRTPLGGVELALARPTSALSQAYLQWARDYLALMGPAADPPPRHERPTWLSEADVPPAYR